MCRFRFIGIFAALILGSGNVITFQAHGAEPLIETPAKQPSPLLEILVEVGKKYDHFFTIEEAWKNRESMNAMESQRVQGALEKKNLQQELEQLRRLVPNLTYEIDKANPRVIHIIDGRLARQKGYGIESIIQSIDFTGSTNDLVAAIRNQGVPVAPQTSLFMNEFQDYGTVVQVKGANLKVRDVLSNFVPLEGRGGRILWIARTKLGQGEVTRIYYPYPGKKP